MDTISPAGRENAAASGHTTHRKTAHKERVEVITRGERRRSWTVEQKREIARESLAPGASVAAVARKHEIPTGLLYTWRKRLQRGELGGEPRFLRVVTSNEGGEPREAPAATGYPWRSVSQEGPGSAGLIEIVLPRGACVRVGAQTDLVMLRRVLVMLEGG